jgi:hypothetical protein
MVETILIAAAPLTEVTMAFTALFPMYRFVVLTESCSSVLVDSGAIFHVLQMENNLAVYLSYAYSKSETGKVLDVCIWSVTFQM